MPISQKTYPRLAPGSIMEIGSSNSRPEGSGTQKSLQAHVIKPSTKPVQTLRLRRPPFFPPTMWRLLVAKHLHLRTKIIIHSYSRRAGKKSAVNREVSACQSQVRLENNTANKEKSNELPQVSSPTTAKKKLR